MVCLCCNKIVANELEKLQINYTCIELGEVNLSKPISNSEQTQLKTELLQYGLELMEDPKAILVEKIVSIIVQKIHKSEDSPHINFSVYLSNYLHQDYHTLSALFSKTKGITIEHFILLHKIEYVKELIIYNQLTLTEIAYKLNYSSVAHLSTQFKKITGITPTFFKRIRNKQRIPLENL